LGQPVARGGAGLFALSLGLATLAGWVDAVGLIKAHDLFVSFMSGNTTELVTGLAQGVSGSLRFATVICPFVLGVVVGELVAGPSERPRRALVLAFETALLSAAALSDHLGGNPLLTCAFLALAMGAQNASVHEAGGVSMALTYVTGGYVHLGRGIAQALTGRAHWSKVVPYASLILALVLGVFVGALALRSLHEGAIAVAAVACLLLAVAAGWLSRADGAPTAA